MQSSWREEHSQALREYLARGLSYSEIANAINERFNTAYTRNAAIGRARRMGLSGPKQPDRRARPKAPPKPSIALLKKLRARLFTEFRPRPEILKRAAELKLRCIGIVPRHLSLLELEDGDCRYPYGGDEEGEAITFCGHPRREGSSYCTSHFHLTSNPLAREAGPAPERAAGRASLRLVEAA
jgi:GcrA cell cycle regulator